MQTKICSECKQNKTIDNFWKDKKTKDGYFCYCKVCDKQRCTKYRKSNPDKWADYQKDNASNIKRWRKKYALYNKKDKLTIDEEPRLAEDGKSLEVRCKYCDKYFKPTNLQLQIRVDALIGKQSGDGYLYCSDGCKYSCSIYGQHLYPRDFKPATSREVQPALRKLVLERDNWTCQKCGSTDTLHCHHIDPVASNPIESADVDNCITFCIDCHIESHKKDGCGYRELANC